MGLEKFLEKKRRKQTGGFLSRYDFAYAGRDTVNQVQVIKTGGTEIERIAPKIIRGAIEEVYKTPFRLLGNLDKKQFQKIKRRLFK